ncbi:MAG: benzoyl-CoA-dihydrodiol lyase [Deltaproteobacteria bacterium CG2_30_63_29]|nr:MAG: benzoyl-CoA-dihydrodiol lyase [Deltaproteobacteria bacterium CG2_30_63_29]PJB42512.1 MAG: benzoyl-CoA-dihydrodiol lyase [Deltaproteobacteria bacterium CG_4_9_14_3_um_filter_63_12]
MAKEYRNPLDYDFQRHPDTYRQVKLEVIGPVAWIKLDVKEDEGLAQGYQLKLNSYDLGVDIELADAVNRLRFEHPEVGCVVVSSALEGVFCSGANIFMLGQSSHTFKVNFCKYTNETRLYIEDASANSGQTYIAALNGVASGGGYELPLACEEIYLIDDRKSAIALPEVPYLGVLPGTGGITRVVDKRKLRRDLADIFLTLAEGVKGSRAVKWGLVDDTFKSSTFWEQVDARAATVAAGGHPERKGVALERVDPVVSDSAFTYQYVTLSLGDDRIATLELRVPATLPDIPEDPTTLGSGWWALRAFRELDDALLRLRFHLPQIGVVKVQTRGDLDTILKLDGQLAARAGNWFVNEVIHHMKRVLKRMDVTSKSFFALIDPGSCFGGSLLELALAADRQFMFDGEAVAIALSAMNNGTLPMGNGLTRLASRFYGDPSHATALAAHKGRIEAQEADELGLVTYALDDLDWEDELRLAIEERASLSPDALTGMEANTRFAGPETLETKIFGRLSAWQNWIFQRPNAVGERGALTLYGQPQSAEYDFDRT